MPKVLQNARRQILEAAEELLSEKGFEKLTMRDLAKRSNMALGTLYNYYLTKSSLVYDLMNDDWNECVKQMREYARSSDTQTFFSEIYATLKEFIASHSELWVETVLGGPPAIGSANAGRYSPERYYRDIYNIIKPVIVKDNPGMEHPDFVARFIAINISRCAAEPDADYRKIGPILQRIICE